MAEELGPQQESKETSQQLLSKNQEQARSKTPSSVNGTTLSLDDYSKIQEENQRIGSTNFTPNWQKAHKGFNVTDFRKQIRGVAYSSKFYFRFPDNNVREYLKLQGDKLDIFDKLFYYSDDQFQVPNRRFDLNDAYHYSNGFSVITPNQTKYGDGHMSITFRLDDKYLLYDIFNDWMSKIHDNKTGFLSFYDDYTTDLEVYQLPYDKYISSIEKSKDPLQEFVNTYANNDHPDVYKIILVRCFPISVGNIQYSHSGSQFTKVAIEFHYSGLKYEKIVKEKREIVSANHSTLPGSVNTDMPVSSTVGLESNPITTTYTNLDYDASIAKEKLDQQNKTMLALSAFDRVAKEEIRNNIQTLADDILSQDSMLDELLLENRGKLDKDNLPEYVTAEQMEFMSPSEISTALTNNAAILNHESMREGAIELAAERMIEQATDKNGERLHYVPPYNTTEEIVEFAATWLSPKPGVEIADWFDSNASTPIEGINTGYVPVTYDQIKSEGPTHRQWYLENHAKLYGDMIKNANLHPTYTEIDEKGNPITVTREKTWEELLDMQTIKSHEVDPSSETELIGSGQTYHIYGFVDPITKKKILDENNLPITKVVQIQGAISTDSTVKYIRHPITGEIEKIKYENEIPSEGDNYNKLRDPAYNADLLYQQSEELKAKVSESVGPIASHINLRTGEILPEIFEGNVTEETITHLTTIQSEEIEREKFNEWVRANRHNLPIEWYENNQSIELDAENQEFFEVKIINELPYNHAQNILDQSRQQQTNQKQERLSDVRAAAYAVKGDLEDSTGEFITYPGAPPTMNMDEQIRYYEKMRLNMMNRAIAEERKGLKQNREELIRKELEAKKVEEYLEAQKQNSKALEKIQKHEVPLGYQTQHNENPLITDAVKDRLSSSTPMSDELKIMANIAMKRNNPNIQENLFEIPQETLNEYGDVSEDEIFKMALKKQQELDWQWKSTSLDPNSLDNIDLDSQLLVVLAQSEEEKEAEESIAFANTSLRDKIRNTINTRAEMRGGPVTHSGVTYSQVMPYEKELLKMTFDSTVTEEQLHDAWYVSEDKHAQQIADADNLSEAYRKNNLPPPPIPLSEVEPLEDDVYKHQQAIYHQQMFHDALASRIMNEIISRNSGKSIADLTEDEHRDLSIVSNNRGTVGEFTQLQAVWERVKERYNIE